MSQELIENIVNKRYSSGNLTAIESLIYLSYRFGTEGSGSGFAEPAAAELAQLRAEVARWKEENERACVLVAQMHAAAVGEVCSPKRGVVEDVEDLRAELAEARATLNEALSVLELSDYDGLRTKSIRAAEDEQVRALCERVGYGAVMDSAARQWFIKDANGAGRLGACALIVRGLVAKIKCTLQANAEAKQE